MVNKRTKTTEKFDFSLDFQEDLLKFTVNDRDGYKVVKLYESDYFSIVEHAAIAEAIKKYYKKHKRVPGYTILKEDLLLMLNSKEYAQLVTKDDISKIITLAKSLYSGPPRDSDQIFQRAAKFASYVEFKRELENVDITDYNSYTEFSSKIMKAIAIGETSTEEKGTFIIGDFLDRQVKRHNSEYVYPTPFRQVNELTNAGGYSKGSIIVVLDRPKRSKTLAMVVVVKGYMKLKRKILVIDFENGQDSWAIRLEQSLSGLSKREIIYEENDSKITKQLRKYKRLGSEVYIKRLPAFSTSANVEALLDSLYRDHGFKPEIIIGDYFGLMGSLSGASDDHKRISDVYLDMGNLALKWDIIHMWTPHHINQEAYKRYTTKYREDDFAKCKEIGRHVHAVFGLNRTQDEEDNNIIRMELVVQRDGLPDGRALFTADQSTQRMIEFTVAQRKAYDEETHHYSNDDEDGKTAKKARKTDLDE